MRKTINVSKADIKAGCDNKTQFDAENCPIAMAMNRALGRPVSVKLYTWHFISRKAGQWFRLPPKAQDFIISFDMGGPVEPFSFTAIYSE